MLIDQKDSVRALRAVHGRFYLATLPLGVGLVGPGLIGGTFLDQIHQQMTVCCLCDAVQQHMAVDPPWEVDPREADVCACAMFCSAGQVPGGRHVMAMLSMLNLHRETATSVGKDTSSADLHATCASLACCPASSQVALGSCHSLFAPNALTGQVACVQELRGNFDIDVRILGIMSSSRMLLSESSIDLANWKQHFQQCASTLCLFTLSISSMALSADGSRADMIDLRRF